MTPNVLTDSSCHSRIQTIVCKHMSLCDARQNFLNSYAKTICSSKVDWYFTPIIILFLSYNYMYRNSSVKPWGLINFIVHSHPSWNWDLKRPKHVQFGFVSWPGFNSTPVLIRNLGCIRGNTVFDLQANRRAHLSWLWMTWVTMALLNKSSVCSNFTVCNVPCFRTTSGRWPALEAWKPIGRNLVVFRIQTSSKHQWMMLQVNIVRKKISGHCTEKPLSTMLDTCKNVLFPGHNHLLTTGTDDPTLLIIAWALVRVIIKVSGHQHWWLAGWLWPGNRTFLEVASMVVSWWIVAFLPSGEP